MLRISLFGQPSLVLDATPLRFNAPPKTLPLLAYLLLHRAQPVAREQVAFALWPDERENIARANLRRHLHQLLHALPAAAMPWIINTGRALQWNAQSDLWLDVAEFERLRASPRTLAQAVTLYRGDLLDTLCEDWLFFERERLRDLYLADLEHLIAQHRSRRDYAKAIGYAQQLLMHDPLREDVVRQGLALRYEAGDRAGALHEYERFAQLLHQELSMPPMPETQALHDQIVHNTLLISPSPAFDLTPDRASTAATLPALEIRPFVGREIERQQLDARWSRAAHGFGGLLLIGGEAGIGKSRLAHELALSAEAQGGRVLRGHTAPEETQPYQALIQACRAALPMLLTLDLEPVRLAAIAALLPELTQRHALPALDLERERLRLFDALAACFEKLARPRPVLLLLEDLHWAGEATLSLVEFLARRAAAAPVLIVATYREEETPRGHPLRHLRRRLQKETLADHIALTGLTTAALTDWLIQVMPATVDACHWPQLAARLWAASEGNPLFVSLLMQPWFEADTNWIDQIERDPKRTLPESLRAIIASRLDQLSPTARAVAEVAAVAGPIFSTELVREVGGWNEASVLDALNELLDRRLVHDAGGQRQFDYAFAHAVIQQTLYADLPPDRLKHRHRRVGQIMEELYADRLAEIGGELAVHFDRGGEFARAVVYYRRTAYRLINLYADTEALHAIERALALLAPASVSDRFEMLALREGVYHRRGERAAQWADLEQLAALANDDEARCAVLHRQIAYFSVTGERAAEADRVERLRACADRAPATLWQARAYLVAVQYQVLISDYAQAQLSLQRAAELAQQSDDAAGQVAAQCALADVAVQQGHFETAQAALKLAGQLAGAQSNRSVLVTALRAASGASFAKQDFEAAHAVATQMLDVCRAIGDREGEADALARLAAVAARRYQVQTARQLYAEAERGYNALGKRQGQAAVMVNTTMLLVGRLGRYAEGLALTRQADTIFRELKDVRGQAICALNEGMITLYLEDYAAGRAASRRGLDLARQMNSRLMEANALANLGAAERELGELTAAIEHMEEGLAIRRTLGQPAELGTDLCDLTVAYCRQGRLDAAQHTLREMLDVYAQAEASMMHPQYILWAAAQTQRVLGDDACAQDYLKRAVQAMQQRLADIPEPELQASYYELPFNRQIVAASERGVWPT
ncbi:MAG: AAA family ATPase [Thermoflexales bacterium]|nr:AAA family ATPase [Thermoflexales bacterium]